MGLQIILAFGKKYWPYIVLTLLIASIYGFINGLYNEIDIWQTKYDKLSTKCAADAATYKANEVALKSAIEQGNIKIQELHDIVSASDDIIEIYEEEAAHAQAAHEEELKKLLNKPTPKTCEGSIQHLRDAAKELTWPK
jgi:hypothetical protein